MKRLFARSFFGALAIACSSVSAWAAPPEPGAILIAEGPSEGTILNIGGGGDFTASPRFASGLEHPLGLCQAGPDGKIYVSEFSSNEVTEITDGGSFSGAAAHAYGFTSAWGLWCDGSQILLAGATSGGSGVFDITSGGDFTGQSPFASGISSPIDVHKDAAGEIWVSALFDGVYKVTEGGDFSAAAPYASSGGDTTTGLGELGGKNYVVQLNVQVLDFTLGGDSSELPTLGSLASVKTVKRAGNKLLAAAGSEVYDVTEGTVPNLLFAEGVNTSETYLIGLAYVEGCGDGIEQGDEECDDGNTDDGDGCSKDCEDEENTGTGGGGAGGSGAGSGTGGSGAGGGAGGDAGGVDAGSGGGVGSGGLGPDAGAGGGAGDDSGQASAGNKIVKSGCGCRTTSDAKAPPFLAIAWLLVPVLLRRARARQAE